MEYRFPLGTQGTMKVREEGPRAVIEARLPDDNRGLYKASLTGAGGRVLLGTLIPEKGVLTLRRTLSVDQLRRQGAWPPTGGAVVLAFPAAGGPDACPEGWQWQPPPLERVTDPPLQQGMRRLSRVLLRWEGEHFSMALPWSPGQPFPLPPLFCLSRPVRLGGRGWLVFAFDRSGRPVVPPVDGAGWMG